MGFWRETGFGVFKLSFTPTLHYFRFNFFESSLIKQKFMVSFSLLLVLICCARARLGKRSLVTSRNCGMGVELEGAGGFRHSLVVKAFYVYLFIFFIFFLSFSFFLHGNTEREKKTGFRSELERFRCWGFFYLVGVWHSAFNHN